MGKQRLILSNLVYGVGVSYYPDLWLENQLKSLCDPTNFPAIREKYDIEYALFSDEETMLHITRHPNFMRLSQVCNIQHIRIQWPADSDRFASRYMILTQMFHQILPVALEKKAWLGVWVADLVFAKHSIPKMLSHLERGHDAVFNVPIRSAADSLNPILKNLTGAPTDMELFEMAYNHLHHLWVASHWENQLFSKFPYSMLWNSGTGLLAHNFGVTPIVFKPNEDLRKVQGVIDSDVPTYFKNPYWAHDWTDAAVAGVEPLSNGHYPPFLQHRASVNFVCEWAKQGILPAQVTNLDKPLYYPSRARFNAPEIEKQASEIVTEIKNRLSNKS